MQNPGKDSGVSLIEVLIASSLFAVFVLQAMALGLQSYVKVRECLNKTESVITDESRYRLMRSQRGHSFIEIIISLSLALGLTLSFIQSFSIINRLCIQHESLSKMQENARAIHGILQELLTRENGLGCNRWESDMNVIMHHNVNKNEENISNIEGDYLRVNYTKKHYSITKWDDQNHILTIKGTPKWKAGTRLVLSNCRQAEIFALKETPKKVNQTETQIILPQAYYRNQQPFDSFRLSQFHSVVLFTAKTSRVNEKNEAIFIRPT